jgi:hypothetical protein
MKTVVVYQAYGREDILQQNLFSIVSLFKKHEGLQGIHKILIYTDKPEFFQKFLGEQAVIQYEHMDSERLQQWRGAIQFVHRVKIEMLRHAAQLFQNHNLFYMDGDTYFTQDPANLFARIDYNHSYMHEAENIIEKGRDPLSKKIAKFLKKNDFTIKNRVIKIPGATTMWNAGVLGFSPGFFKDLDSVLAFTDLSYSRYQKHVMEQLAFSYFLAEKTDILNAQKEVHHYWRQKDDYNQVILNFLSKTGGLDTALREFNSIKWPAPPPPKKSLFQKLSDKMFGNQVRNQNI